MLLTKAFQRSASSHLLLRVRDGEIYAKAMRFAFALDDLHRVAVSRVADDIYEIMPASELEPGEYLSDLSKDGFEGVYEFGIAAMKK